MEPVIENETKGCGKVTRGDQGSRAGEGRGQDLGGWGEAPQLLSTQSPPTGTIGTTVFITLGAEC